VRKRGREGRTEREGEEERDRGEREGGGEGGRKGGEGRGREEVGIQIYSLDHKFVDRSDNKSMELQTKALGCCAPSSTRELPKGLRPLSSFDKMSTN